MAFDRLGINIEDFDIPSLTLTNIITFVKTLAQAVKALGGIFKNILNSKINPSNNRYKRKPNPNIINNPSYNKEQAKRGKIVFFYLFS